MVRRVTWTWARVEAAAAGTAGWKRTRRGEWHGPCQCGGERDRAWIRDGRRGVIAGCNGGCDGVAVIRWLVGDESAGTGARWRDDRPRPLPFGRPKTPRPVQARTTPLPGGGPSKPPNPAPSSEPDASSRRSAVAGARTAPHTSSRRRTPPATEAHSMTRAKAEDLARRISAALAGLAEADAMQACALSLEGGLGVGVGGVHIIRRHPKTGEVVMVGSSGMLKPLAELAEDLAALRKSLLEAEPDPDGMN